MPKKQLPVRKKKLPGYDGLLLDVSTWLEKARQSTGRTINTLMTMTYWQIGRRIVAQELKGGNRAAYGKELVTLLAEDLSERFGRGFSRSNVFQMRQFFLIYSEKVQTVSGQLEGLGIVQTLSGQSLEKLPFPLSWSHYVRLLTVSDDQARNYYETESIRGGWSVRELDRQIATQAYQRLRGRRAKALSKTAPSKPSPDYGIRDPLVLEFLDLKDEYSEAEMEDALITDMQGFLLELGNDFAFAGRQKRLRIGREWYRIDLMFFNRRLRCLVIIDLKIGKFTHADAGQMNLYLNYAREHWTLPGENPPVGLILCSEQDKAVAHYALEGLSNTVLAREYKLALPDARKLEKQMKQTHHRLLE